MPSGSALERRIIACLSIPVYDETAPAKCSPIAVTLERLTALVRHRIADAQQADIFATCSRLIITGKIKTTTLEQRVLYALQPLNRTETLKTL